MMSLQVVTWENHITAIHCSNSQSMMGKCTDAFKWSVTDGIGHNWPNLEQLASPPSSPSPPLSLSKYESNSQSRAKL